MGDIKLLELNGIHVNVEGCADLFYGSISMTVADNLAAHAIGCFYENFSSVEKFCRFCDMRNSVFKSKDFLNYNLRTKEGYLNNAKLVQQNPDLLKLYGVKDCSFLNDLRYYNVVDGLPPDPAHDLFEGFLY